MRPNGFLAGILSARTAARLMHYKKLPNARQFLGVRRRRRAFAVIQVLVLLTFLMAMIAAAMQHNATQREYLKLRQDGSQALSLAESGAQEALHRLAARPEAGAAERRVGRGGFRAEWRPADSVQGAFDIVSTGWARADHPETARKVVRVRAALTRSDPAVPWTVRVLSWRQE